MGSLSALKLKTDTNVFAKLGPMEIVVSSDLYDRV